MTLELWMGVAVITLGTWMMRYLPFLWMQSRLRRSEAAGKTGSVPSWLGVIGPVMIAALLGVSLVPVNPSSTSWLATLVGSVATLALWYRLRTLGLPVLAGVAAYGIVTWGATYLL